MASCHYCGYGEGGHDKACPESMTGEAKIVADKSWEAGYRVGRSTGDEDEEPAEVSATFSLGYGRGIVAKEEAENGFDPRFEDPVDPSEDEIWDDVSADPAYYDSDEY
jgi:hypothetical protein